MAKTISQRAVYLERVSIQLNEYCNKFSTVPRMLNNRNPNDSLALSEEWEKTVS